MAECYICFVSDQRSELVDGVSGEGIMKVCRKCAESENIPIIKRHVGYNRGVVERPQSVHERLSRISGLEVREEPEEKRELKKQETTLKEIVDRNYEERIEKKGIKTKGKAEDLVDNFHWILMRVRRLKKATPEEVATDLTESASAIKMLEKGVLGDNYIELVKKLEKYYNVKLIKDEFREKEKTPISVVHDAELLGTPEDLFIEDKARALTISDLRGLRKKKEMDLFQGEEKVPAQLESRPKETISHPGEIEEPDYMMHEHASEDEPEFVEKHEEVIEEGEENTSTAPDEEELRDVKEEMVDEEAKTGEEISAERMKEDKKGNNSKKQLSDEDIDKILYGGK